MTLREARDVLGLGPSDDPRPLLGELQAEREMLATMVRDAPNATLAMRHQDALVRFDQALAAVRETMEALGLQETMSAPVKRQEPAGSLVAEDHPSEPKSSRMSIMGVGLFLGIVFLSVGFWIHQQYDAQKRKEFEIRVSSLRQKGDAHIENRRWAEAGAVFLEIERLVPDRPTGRLGLARIEVGIAEERSQFIGYWTGEARAALDSSRWDDAEAAANAVLERFPEQPDAMAVLDEIAGAKIAEARREAIAEATAQLDRGNPEEALEAATTLMTAYAGDQEIADLADRARTALERQHADLARATALFEKARQRDTGAFDEQALEWLREAALLAPHDEEIGARLERMASYTRTLRVPEDFAGLEEALASARENDRILLGPGIWQGVFVINLPVELQGAGPEETFLECSAIAGCAITVGPEATGARVSGIAFRHRGFDAGPDRYSAALVRGGSVAFVDCHFLDASGHGLAVIEGSQVEIQRCHFHGNGWNGIAAKGEATVVSASESRIDGNFGHGVEAWDGAQLALDRCRIHGNAGNAIHLDTTAQAIRIEGCELVANREFGIVLTAAKGGRISGNRIQQNQLGGIAVRQAAAAVRIDQNEIISNTGPGLLLDHGLADEPYRNNTLGQNTGNTIVTRAKLTPAAED